jgi:hypothetical protein
MVTFIAGNPHMIAARQAAAPGAKTLARQRWKRKGG